MTDFGTFLPLACTIPDGSSCQKQTFRAPMTGIAEQQKVSRLQFLRFREQTIQIAAVWTTSYGSCCVPPILCLPSTSLFESLNANLAR